MNVGSDLQHRLDEAAIRHDVPGVVVAVGHDGRLAEAATGVVNRDTNVAATPDSVFQIASVTKVWTAILIMQLVDEGLVDLDAPVRRYLPEFTVIDERASESVTVCQLLSHTGGFVGDLFEDTGCGDDALDKYLSYLGRAAGQVHPPGAMFSYCNSGYCVLGAVLARLRGGSWESVLRERLLEPLGVTHVALGAEEAILFRAAVGHSRPPDARRHSVLRRWVQPRSVAPAGATACAAPRELVRVGQMLSAGGVAADGTRLLSPAATAAMLTPQVAVPGVPGRSATHWGLGLMLFNWNGTPAFGHDGDQLGQSSLLFVVPQHRFVVALCANSNTIAGLIDDLVIPIVEDVTGIALPPRPVPPPRPAPFDAHRYVGRYVAPLSAYEVNTAGAALQITAIPQGFAAETGQSRTDRYVPLADETFIAIEPENGSHKTLTFVDSARYLHDLRAVPRVE